jgi:hypothetical protein
MPDRAKLIERREQMETYRKSRHELAHVANKQAGEPLIKAMARIIRKQEKKRIFTSRE